MPTENAKGAVLGFILVAFITTTTFLTHWVASRFSPIAACSAPDAIQKRQAPATYPPLRSQTEFATNTSGLRNIAIAGVTARAIQ